MNSKPGTRFEVEPKLEEMEVEKNPGAKKAEKKVVAVKSKTPSEMQRLAKKKANKVKRLAREQKKKGPKKKPRKQFPKRRVARRKAMRKKKR